MTVLLLIGERGAMHFDTGFKKILRIIEEDSLDKVLFKKNVASAGEKSYSLDLCKGAWHPLLLHWP